MRLWSICLSQTSSLIVDCVARRRAADVVDEDVDAAEALHAVVHGGLDLFGLRHVDAAREAGAAFLLDDGLGDVSGLLAQIDAIDRGALARQQHGRGLAVAPHLGVGVVADRAGTRNEGDFALEAEHDRFPLSGTAGT